MEYNKAWLSLRVTGPESYIRVGDLASLLEAIQTLHEAFVAVFVFAHEPFEKARLGLAADDQTVLRIAKLWSGGNVNVSVVGIEQAIKAIRKIVDAIRFRKERRMQEEEKTLQEKEKTQQMEEKTALEVETTRKMRMENLKRELDTFLEIKAMSVHDRRQFFRLIEQQAARIEDNRNTLLPHRW